MLPAFINPSTLIRKPREVQFNSAEPFSLRFVTNRQTLVGETLAARYVHHRAAIQPDRRLSK